MTATTSRPSLLPRLVRRIKELIFATDFDSAEAYNALVALGCGAVLLLPGDYLKSSTRLLILDGVFKEPVWAALLLSVGAIEAAMLVLGGMPAVMATSTRSNLHWYVFRACGLVFALFVWGMLCALFSLSGPSWGSITFGTLGIGSLWGTARLGSLIACDREYLRLKSLRDKPQETAREIDREIASKTSSPSPPSSPAAA
jgi:hypothetical protein